MFNRLDNKMDAYLKKEAVALRTSLRLPEKARLKRHILEQVQLQESSLVEKIRGLVASFKLSSLSSFMIKESLWYKLGFASKQVKQPLWHFGGVFMKRSFTFGTAAVLLTALVVQPWAGVFTASADSKTYVASLTGAVSIDRNGADVSLYEGFELQTGDIITVGLQGAAELRIFDTTVVRLRENSRIEVTDLLVDSGGQVAHLDLQEGELWTSVFSTFGDFSEFKVVSGDLSVYANDPARFSLKRGVSSSHVVAIDQELDVVLQHNKQLIKRTLLPEQIVRFGKAQPLVSYRDRVSIVESSEDIDFYWYEKNLIADRLFEDELKSVVKTRIEQGIAISPDSYLYPLKELSRTTRLAFTFNDAEKQKQRLNIAHEKFIEAQYVLQKSEDLNKQIALTTDKDQLAIKEQQIRKQEVARELLDDYQKEIAGVVINLPKIVSADPVGADKIQRQLAADLSKQKNNLDVLKDQDALLLARVVQAEAEQEIGLLKENTKPLEVLDTDFGIAQSQIVADVGSSEGSAEQVVAGGVILSTNVDLAAVEVAEAGSAEELVDDLDVLVESEEGAIIVEQLTELKEVKKKTGVTDDQPSTIDESKLQRPEPETNIETTDATLYSTDVVEEVGIDLEDAPVIEIEPIDLTTL